MASSLCCLENNHCERCQLIAFFSKQVYQSLPRLARLLKLGLQSAHWLVHKKKTVQANIHKFGEVIVQDLHR